MKRIVVFAGTTEGRRLASHLASLPLEAVFCVATEYGGQLLNDIPGRFRVLTGRLDAEEIRELLEYRSPCLVVDATHPYAAEVSKNIETAASQTGIQRLRLLRPASEEQPCRYAGSAAEAARLLAGTEGNILLTTGSKELAAYTAVPNFAERIYPRVLPTAEAIRQCEELGYRRGHIAALQGPFSRDFNRAMMEQYAVRVLVTKDGGEAGGFSEKMLAAGDAGAEVIVIGRPPETSGMDLDAVLECIRRLAGET